MSVSQLPLLCQWWWGEDFYPKKQLNMFFQTQVKMYISLCQTQLPRRTGGPTPVPNSPGGNFDFAPRFEKSCQHWPQVTTPASSTLASSPGQEPPSMTSSWKALFARLSTLLLGSRSISSFLCNFLSHVSSSCVCLRSHQWTILHFISSFLESEQCKHP